MQTTFEKVVILNEAFGNQAGNITDPNWARIQNQAKLVLEETTELLKAAFYDKEVVVDVTIKPLDEPVKVDIRGILRELLDAQGDITTVNDGVAHIMGVSGNEVLERVQASNLSKFVRSQEEVGPALDYYYSRGFPEGNLRIEGEFPRACIKVNETVMWNGKEYPAGKFLKNFAAFKEPFFEDILDGSTVYQINRIILSATALGEHQILIPEEGGCALVTEEVMEHLFRQPIEMDAVVRDDESEGVPESYLEVYELNEQNLPEVPALWGKWTNTTRVFTACPFSVAITELVRSE